MQPNNPYEPEPTGIDYLNQIATPAQPAVFDKKTKTILIIAGVVGLLSLGLIAITSINNSNSGPSPASLVARLQKLDRISTTFGDKLRSPALQEANSSLSAVLITANQSIAALDPGTELEAELNDAYLNGYLDSAYAREMAYQLEETLVMMNRLRDSTKVVSMQEFLDKTISDFENLKKRFSEADKV
ncbi:hypothetical protein B7Y94_05770 [Candidatus Saccharibacteria bacterium 32-49-12]|nr:MAG: hypothetical protein B7Y94_05770 [Candidatus Saccharibacteria bacterium 32-49-12]